MKKRAFFTTLITLTLLSAMLLSFFLGVTKAEYFKSMSQKLGFEAIPDLGLEYYLFDGNTEGTTGNNNAKTYHGKTGVYKNKYSKISILDYKEGI